jgi:cobalt-zinc-cadmium efflux system membrane fusion protein
VKFTFLIIAICLFMGCDPSQSSTDKDTSRSDGLEPGAPIAGVGLEPGGPNTPNHEGHGVPLDLCTRCNPALAQVFKAKGDWCAEHEFPESFCPICHPDVAPPDVSDKGGKAQVVFSDGQIEGRVVRFVDPAIEERSGIKFVEAIKAEGSAQISCSAELSFNANKVADIRAIVPGVVRTVSIELGQDVKKGDALFVLESTQIGDIQAGLRTANERVRVAEADLERQRTLRKSEIASARQVEVAESELASAQSAAQSAASTLRMAGAQKSSSGRFTLRAPISGQVVRRPGVMGGLATQDDSLATVADTSTMWAMCAIPEREAGRVQEGFTLKLELNNGTSVVGKITWISPEVDERTRMVNARAEIPNPDGLLRANQFLNASIIAGAPKASVVVPRDSVQRIEGRDVVFARAKAGTYIPRVVNVYGDGENVAVEGKVKVGDQIVTDGAVFLRTEVLPGSIGAGCCEVEAPGGD